MTKMRKDNCVASMPKKKMKLLIMLLMIITLTLLTVPKSSAIGITPGMKTINFESGMQEQGMFTIINNEHKAFNAFIFLQGDLKNSVSIGKNIVEFKETTNSADFSYSINLPSSVEKPGEHIVKIIVMEMPSDSDLGNMEGNAIIATAAVAHQLKIKVPYPGKYAEMEMHVSESEVNEITSFIFPVSNLGTENIEKAKVMVEILGPTNEKIAEVESNEISILSKERKELVAQWKANVNAGNYHAVATLEYDGKFAKVEKTFAVGNLLVDISDVSVKNFNLGGVAKFDINIESKWNGDINGMYADMQIYNSNNDLISDVKSASADLKPLEKTTINTYWDTAGVNIGDYKAKITLNFNGKTVQKEMTTHVEMNKITTEISGIVGKVTAEESANKKAGMTNLFIFLLVGVLIAINLAWFLYFRKRKKKVA